MSKMSMLEYSKLILDKVSFDTSLFIKELQKAINQLLDHEINELENWVRKRHRQHMELVALPLHSLKQ